MSNTLSANLKPKEQKVYEQAKQHISQNDAASARSCLVSYSKKNKLSLPTLHLLCLSYALSNQFKKSLDIALKLDKKKPNTIEFLKLIGSSYHGLTKYPEAIKYFKKAITINSSDITALSNLASALKEDNQLEEAEKYFMHSLSLNSNQPDALTNLGLLLQLQSKYSEAIQLHKKALQISPNNVNVLHNLAFALKVKGDKEESITYYNQLLTFMPGHARAACDSSQIYSELKQFEKAIEVLKSAYDITPTDEHVLSNMGIVYKMLNQNDKAEEFFLKAIEKNPENETPQYFLSILKGDNSFGSSPDGYVQELFDGYAETFDEQLISQLKYKTPELIGNQIAKHIDPSQKYNILDLGCGTGLAGIYVKDIAKSMTGVDLSENMLNKAKERNIYTELVTSGIEQYFESSDATPDIIISADVFVYIGDLANIFSAASKAMNEGGYFVFSTEDTKDAGQFLLKDSGRFAHNEQYIRTLAQTCNFTFIENLETVIRYDANKPIHGQVYLLKR